MLAIVGDGEVRAARERGALKPVSTMIRSTVRFGRAVSMVLLAAACDSAPGPEAQRPEPALRGVDLVVGTTVDQWSLLSVPQAGGVAEIRNLSDPQRVLWTGDIELPASVEARALPGGRIVLRSAEGVVHTYDAPSGALVRVGEVAPEAVWMGDASVGLFLSPGGSLLEVGRKGVWSYGLEEEVSWAAPAEGGVLVAVADAGGRNSLWLLRHGEDEPAEAGAAPVRSPGIVTAWGRRAVLTSEAGRGLTVFTVSPIESAGELDLGGSVLALATSPSTHEVYAALDDPPRLVAVNRFNLTSRVLSELASPAKFVRSSLFGEGILVEQDGRAARIPVAGGAPGRVPATWRADLPVGLPDGRVVGTADGSMLVVDPVTGAVEVLEDAESESWWMAVHWNPAEAVVTADRLASEVVRSPAVSVEPDSSVDPASPTEPQVTAPGSRSAESSTDASGPPAGFYAIVGSARQAEGIQTLVQSLRDSGFATQIQSFPDEAGRTWFRGLVGPYGSRSEAEAAARQLLRERRLEAWVTEVGTRGRPEDESI
jgi:cell division septation protein DedD